MYLVLKKLSLVDAVGSEGRRQSGVTGRERGGWSAIIFHKVAGLATVKVAVLHIFWPRYHSIHAAKIKPRKWRSNMNAVQGFEVGVFFVAVS